MICKREIITLYGFFIKPLIFVKNSEYWNKSTDFKTSFDDFEMYKNIFAYFFFECFIGHLNIIIYNCDVAYTLKPLNFIKS